MKRSHSFLRLVSITLLQSFIFQQVSFAEITSPLKHDPLEKPKVDLRIPESVASLEDAYRNGSDKTIYLIQDAHTNESGQMNLARALESLLEWQPGLKYVFTEAAVGDSSLSFLRPFTPLSVRKPHALSYIKKGILHGEEYLDLISDKDMVLWGVEDPGLYLKTLEAYRSVANDRDRFDLYLKKIDAALTTLQGRLMNPALQQFNDEMRAFQSGGITLTQYFQALWRESKLRSIDIKKYPHLKNLEVLKAKEEQIDFRKANEEQIKALQSLSLEDQKTLTDRTESQKNTPFKLGNSNAKEGKAFYTLLEERLKDEGRGTRDDSYPELFKYFEYLKLAKQIEAKNVLSELKALENEVLGVLSKTPDEKELMKCQQVLRHLEKLFHFTLTPEEFKEYRDLTSSFGLDRLTGFLNAKIMELGTYYERAIFLEQGYGDMVRSAEGFYALTFERDLYFVQQMISKMDLESQKNAVLITGGFHTVNIKELLKARHISFVSLTPQVLKETNMKRYEDILLGQRMIGAAQTQVLKIAASHDRTTGIMTTLSGLQPGADEAALAFILPLIPTPAAREALGARLARTDKGANIRGDRSTESPMRKIIEQAVENGTEPGSKRFRSALDREGLTGKQARVDARRGVEKADRSGARLTQFRNEALQFVRDGGRMESATDEYRALDAADRQAARKYLSVVGTSIGSLAFLRSMRWKKLSKWIEEFPETILIAQDEIRKITNNPFVFQFKNLDPASPEILDLLQGDNLHRVLEAFRAVQAFPETVEFAYVGYSSTQWEYIHGIEGNTINIDHVDGNILGALIGMVNPRAHVNVMTEADGARLTIIKETMENYAAQFHRFVVEVRTKEPTMSLSWSRVRDFVERSGKDVMQKFLSQDLAPLKSQAGLVKRSSLGSGSVFFEGDRVTLILRIEDNSATNRLSYFGVSWSPREGMLWSDSPLETLIYDAALRPSDVRNLPASATTASADSSPAEGVRLSEKKATAQINEEPLYTAEITKAVEPRDGMTPVIVKVADKDGRGMTSGLMRPLTESAEYTAGVVARHLAQAINWKSEYPFLKVPVALFSISIQNGARLAGQDEFIVDWQIPSFLDDYRQLAQDLEGPRQAQVPYTGEAAFWLNRMASGENTDPSFAADRFRKAAEALDKEKGFPGLAERLRATHDKVLAGARMSEIALSEIPAAIDSAIQTLFASPELSRGPLSRYKTAQVRVWRNQRDEGDKYIVGSEILSLEVDPARRKVVRFANFGIPVLNLEKATPGAEIAKRLQKYRDAEALRYTVTTQIGSARNDHLISIDVQRPSGARPAASEPEVLAERIRQQEIKVRDLGAVVLADSLQIAATPSAFRDDRGGIPLSMKIHSSSLEAAKDELEALRRQEQTLSGARLATATAKLRLRQIAREAASQLAQEFIGVPAKNVQARVVVLNTSGEPILQPAPLTVYGNFEDVIYPYLLRTLMPLEWQDFTSKDGYDVSTSRESGIPVTTVRLRSGARLADVNPFDHLSMDDLPRAVRNLRVIPSMLAADPSDATPENFERILQLERGVNSYEFIAAVLPAIESFVRAIPSLADQRTLDFIYKMIQPDEDPDIDIDKQRGAEMNLYVLRAVSLLVAQNPSLAITPNITEIFPLLGYFDYHGANQPVQEEAYDTWRLFIDAASAEELEDLLRTETQRLEKLAGWFSLKEGVAKKEIERAIQQKSSATDSASFANIADRIQSVADRLAPMEANGVDAKEAIVEELGKLAVQMRGLDKRESQATQLLSHFAGRLRFSRQTQSLADELNGIVTDMGGARLSDTADRIQSVADRLAPLKANGVDAKDTVVEELRKLAVQLTGLNRRELEAIQGLKHFAGRLRFSQETRFLADELDGIVLDMRGARLTWTDKEQSALSDLVLVALAVDPASENFIDASNRLSGLALEKRDVLQELRHKLAADNVDLSDLPDRAELLDVLDGYLEYEPELVDAALTDLQTVLMMGSESSDIAAAEGRLKSLASTKPTVLQDVRSQVLGRQRTAVVFGGALISEAAEDYISNLLRVSRGARLATLGELVDGEPLLRVMAPKVRNVLDEFLAVPEGDLTDTVIDLHTARIFDIVKREILGLVAGTQWKHIYTNMAIGVVGRPDANIRNLDQLNVFQALELLVGLRKHIVERRDAMTASGSVYVAVFNEPLLTSLRISFNEVAWPFAVRDAATLTYLDIEQMENSFSDITKIAIERLVTTEAGKAVPYTISSVPGTPEDKAVTVRDVDGLDARQRIQLLLKIRQGFLAKRQAIAGVSQVQSHELVRPEPKLTGPRAQQVLKALQKITDNLGRISVWQQQLSATGRFFSIVDFNAENGGVWELKGNVYKKLKILKQDEKIQRVFFAPDESWVAIETDRSGGTVIDTATGKAIEFGQAFRGFRGISPDGRFLTAYIGSAENVWILDMTTRKPLIKIDQVGDVDYSEDGEYIVVGRLERNKPLVYRKDGRSVDYPFDTKPEIAPDGRLFIVSDKLLFEPTSGRIVPLANLLNADRKIESAIFMESSERLFVYFEDDSASEVVLRGLDRGADSIPAVEHVYESHMSPARDTVFINRDINRVDRNNHVGYYDVASHQYKDLSLSRSIYRVSSGYSENGRYLYVEIDEDQYDLFDLWTGDRTEIKAESILFLGEGAFLLAVADLSTSDKNKIYDLSALFGARLANFSPVAIPEVGLPENQVLALTRLNEALSLLSGWKVSGTDYRPRIAGQIQRRAGQIIAGEKISAPAAGLAFIAAELRLKKADPIATAVQAALDVLSPVPAETPPTKVAPIKGKDSGSRLALFNLEGATAAILAEIEQGIVADIENEAEQYLRWIVANTEPADLHLLSVRLKAAPGLTAEQRRWTKRMTSWIVDGISISWQLRKAGIDRIYSFPFYDTYKHDVSEGFHTIGTLIEMRRAATGSEWHEFTTTLRTLTSSELRNLWIRYDVPVKTPLRDLLNAVKALRDGDLELAGSVRAVRNGETIDLVPAVHGARLALEQGLSQDISPRQLMPFKMAIPVVNEGPVPQAVVQRARNVDVGSFIDQHEMALVQIAQANRTSLRDIQTLAALDLREVILLDLQITQGTDKDVYFLISYQGELYRKIDLKDLPKDQIQQARVHIGVLQDVITRMKSDDQRVLTALADVALDSSKRALLGIDLGRFDLNNPYAFDILVGQLVKLSRMPEGKGTLAQLSGSADLVHQAMVRLSELKAQYGLDTQMFVTEAPRDLTFQKINLMAPEAIKPRDGEMNLPLGEIASDQPANFTPILILSTVIARASSDPARNETIRHTYEAMVGHTVQPGVLDDILRGKAAQEVLKQNVLRPMLDILLKDMVQFHRAAMSMVRSA